MAKEENKEFFKEPTAAKILKYSKISTISKDLVNRILNMSFDEAAIIEADLIPKDYDNSRKFLKHGPEVKLRRFNSLEEMADIRETPVQSREESLNNIKNRAYSGYSFKPFIGTDKKTRKVSLVECLKGTKLYRYANQEGTKFNPSISVKPYDDATGVEKDGAEIITRVPSRTKKMPNYEFKFSSVPVIDSDKKWGIAYNITTTHNCKSKLYNIRYKHKSEKETSKQFNFCAHEIAAYLSIVDHYWNKEKNLIPLQMNQFAIPTQETVDYYVKLTDNCLIKTSEDKNPRKLNSAEKEIMLWGLVKKLKHDDTFFAKDKVKEYNWGV
ncbi:MAG: hypothetical protein QF798_04010 [Candidatus Woesearchaeota archaeon]|jgi:hypothetical protein|nr:hypothetical protein [archaeon]MDP6600574.1 hypothetical protein [Candidatus Woesearchaeota archaeon]|tara:strand:- start:238 stop:1215 length:978 start_codon:yes stop_codon:yes gene_type:complete